ncbi:carbamoyl-phosphate synthase large subunit [Myxococcota bacterium]|nr:carbamoyl-phosphate synthase large subunit [Myxococcota bacterium]
MPRRNDLHRILIIGSGPIVIGQACEFDYSGAQACRALREEGYEVILVNSNPATIMTDPDLADRTYVEPITPEAVERIILRERPDALLPTMGGQTALNVTMALHESGVLARHRVQLIGAGVDAIRKAEDRELFKAAMDRLGLESARGGFARSMDDAWAIVEETRFPAILRPSFTMGGAGGATCYNREEFKEAVEYALRESPIGEVLIEESIVGWKEYELEVMRDLKDNVVIICSIENFDPMGVHTGDSITVAPAQTLSDREYQAMRDAAVRIIREIGVETGGSNIQFAVDPRDGRMIVVEANPRVSRSSALASKATGFPIARIAAKLAVGYRLDEVPNGITRKTPACFEPTIDYTVVKIPRWAFEKFPGADTTLGTQMKSVGEAMAIGRTFREAFQKAISSLEQDRHGWGADGRDALDPDAVPEADRPRARHDVLRRLRTPRPDNLFWIRYALRLGASPAEVNEANRVDPWFLDQLVRLGDVEDGLRSDAAFVGLGNVSDETLRAAKRDGFSDVQIGWLTRATAAEVRARRLAAGIVPVYKAVDTCAAEFAAFTPYFYSTYEDESELPPPSGRRKVVILGAGPNRIGQGIEFDYCCVHAAVALREAGFETVLVNSNPETVSTDYDIVDRLYFEPLTFESVMEIIDAEKPWGVIVQFGGQTPLKLARRLEAAGVPIIGTSSRSIDLAEDRKLFEALARRIGVRQPKGGTARDAETARRLAAEIGYPVLVRPSYVLGGRGMAIVYDDAQLREYMVRAIDLDPDHPVLVDEFLENAMEVDVDCVADATGRVVVGGVMEHIEEAGIHSGDSSCVLPPETLPEAVLEEIRDTVGRLARELGVVGLMNTQFAVRGGQVHVLEVNPRASRTVPFVSKATGWPLAKIAARVMAGETLEQVGFTQEPRPGHVAVKKVVLPFRKLRGSDVLLGPEMKSTGEVMGIASSFGAAFAKATAGAGEALPLTGAVFVSVHDRDKVAVAQVARALQRMKFRVVATSGTAEALRKAGIRADTVFKVNEGRPNAVDLLKNREIDLVINTPLGKESRFDERAIRIAALQFNVPCITTLSAAQALVKGIEAMSDATPTVRSLQEYHAQVPALAVPTVEHA